MSRLLMTVLLLIAPVLPCMPAPSEAERLVERLLAEEIASVRFSLNPAGADIGFDLEVLGTELRLQPLIDLINGMQPGGGHKCPNAGSIRFRMKDGGMIGIGLLPSHTEDRYEFRLYDGSRYLEAFIVDRAGLLAVMDGLGVPTNDNAFRE